MSITKKLPSRAAAVEALQPPLGRLFLAKPLDKRCQFQLIAPGSILSFQPAS